MSACHCQVNGSPSGRDPSVTLQDRRREHHSSLSEIGTNNDSRGVESSEVAGYRLSLAFFVRILRFWGVGMMAHWRTMTPGDVP